MLEALRGVVEERLHLALIEAADLQGYLTLDALQKAGLLAAYDPARLMLVIQVPPRLRRTSVLTVLGRDGPLPGAEIARPGSVSGFLNVRLAQDLLWAHGRESSPKRQALRAGFESAVNVKGWVVEGVGDLLEASPPVWSRAEVRLVRDVPAWAVRFTAGDLTTPGAGFQPSRTLLGFSATRQFILDPSRQVFPEEDVTLTLERPSTIEVLINGRRARTLKLQAGPHDLRGLLLDLGSNELELVVTDDLGVQQRVTKRVGLASGQLAPGVAEFSYSLGVPVAPGPVIVSRDWNTPTVHLLHRHGLTRALTLGGSVQADPDAQVLALDPVLGTYWGSFAGTVAITHREGTLGYAAGPRYELQGGGNAPSGAYRFGLGAEYRSQGFTLVGGLASTLPSYALNSFYSRSFGAGFFGRASVEGRAQGVDLARSYTGGLSFAKYFTNGLGVMIDTTAGVLAGSDRELRGRLNLIWIWATSRRSVQSITDAGTGGEPNSQLTFNQDYNTGSTGLRTSVGVGRDAFGNRINESVNYRGQRAEVDVSHRMVSPANAPGDLSSLIQTRLGTAVVFADGVFAASRPVTNSFAIVVPSRSLQGQWIGVNPQLQGYAGAVDGLGPAVLPDLQPYAWSTLRMKAPELPVGYSLGNEARALRATYRNGTLVRVGEEGTVILRGVLRDASGAPLALSAGVIERLADDARAPLPFFTNRTGRFALGALRPGRYQLRLDEAGRAVPFSIPEGAAGVYDLGQVSVAQPGPERTAFPYDRTPAAPADLFSTVRGRLFRDRNANGNWDADEPTFAGVRVRAGAVTATTDGDGLYRLERVMGPEAVLKVDAPEQMPFNMVPVERRLAIQGSEFSADLLTPASRIPVATEAPFQVTLPEGKVRVQPLDRKRLALVPWVAGVPLKAAERRQLEQIGRRVFESKGMRLLVVVSSPTAGPLRGAVKQALRGAQALQRYLKATQLVPSSRVAAAVLEPQPGLSNPVGHIDLLLVRVEGPAHP